MSVGPNSPYTQLDQNHILQRTFDESADRLRVDANVTATIGTVEVVIDAASGDNIKISDGTDTLAVNPDGSINVVLSGSVAASPITKLIYNEVTNVANGVTTTVVSITASVKIKILEVNLSGTNIAVYELLRNSSIVQKKRTYFGMELNTDINMQGYIIEIGQTFKIDVTHDRPNVGDFNGTIKYIEV